MIRQYDVCPSPSQRSRGAVREVVVLQSHHIDLDTVIVAPILVSVFEASDVTPAIMVEGERRILALNQMIAVDRRTLGRSTATVADQEDVIRRGLDRLFTGF